MREITFHCQGPACQRHVVSTEEPPVRGWLEVREEVGGRVLVHDYCGWECVMRAASHIEPPVELTEA